MTGRPCPGSGVGEAGISGVQTLSERQSSLCGSDADGSDGLVMPGTAADCGAIGPNVDASRISLPRLGLQRGAPPQRTDRRTCVGDPRERPEVTAPDAPEPPLGDGHHALHRRGPYGDKRERSIGSPFEPIHEQKVNCTRTRDATGPKQRGCRKCHHAAITLLRRGCSELSGHCPQAGSSRESDHGRGSARRIVDDSGGDQRGRDDVHHAAGTGAEPVADQRHPVASQPDRGDAGAGGAADLHPRRQVQHG